MDSWLLTLTIIRNISYSLFLILFLPKFCAVVPNRGECHMGKCHMGKNLFICTPESALCTYSCHDYLYFHCNCLKSIILHCIVL